MKKNIITCLAILVAAANISLHASSDSDSDERPKKSESEVHFQMIAKEVGDLIRLGMAEIQRLEGLASEQYLLRENKSKEVRKGAAKKIKAYATEISQIKDMIANELAAHRLRRRRMAKDPEKFEKAQMLVGVVPGRKIPVGPPPCAISSDDENPSAIPPEGRMG